MLCGKAECSCMCMNGQPRLAGLMLLDLLEKSGTTIYYSGDLDPEGILLHRNWQTIIGESFISGIWIRKIIIKADLRK